MTRLLNASRMVEALLDGRVRETFDELVLDLTLYEVGNALWKNHHLRDRLGVDLFDELVDLVVDLEAQIEVEPVRDRDLHRTMAIATEESITFYDAAYVECAERRGATLITEDEAHRTAASRYVDVGRFGDG